MAKKKSKTLPLSSILLRDEVRAILHLSSRRSPGITRPVQHSHWLQNLTNYILKVLATEALFVLSLSRSKENLVISSGNVFYPSQAKFDSTLRKKFCFKKCKRSLL